jgi:hypothetical protein
MATRNLGKRMLVATWALAVGVACGPSVAVGTGGGSSAGSTSQDDGWTAGNTSISDPTGDSTSSGGDDSSTGNIPSGPIVWIAYDAAPGPDGQSAFAELEHFVDEPHEEPPCEAPGTPPTLGAPILMLNGAPAPADVVIHVGDRVGVLVPFADPGCDLVADVAGFSVEQLGGVVEFSGSPNGPLLPCSTGASLVYIGLDFLNVRFDAPYIVHELRVADACGDEAALVDYRFDVEE